MLVVAERTYVCGACAHGWPTLSAAAMAFLRETSGRGRRTPADIAAADRRGRSDELEHVHWALIAMHLEKELRSARVVRELRPES